jgi:hypothetical protein
MSRWGSATLGLALLLSAGPAGAAATPQAKEEKAEGYAEWKQGDVLVVDGQRVKLAPGAKFKGKGEAKSFATIPLGYEVEAKGRREASGLVLATEVEAKPNGSAMFEKEVRSMTDDAESEARHAGAFLQSGANGRTESIGRLYEDGPEVERVRAIMDALIPPYMDPSSVRCYVIDNPEWNAFAMGNFSVYVFRGLLDDMDDDEVAIVLGHELAHATHEHTRRQFKKQMWIQLAAAGVLGAAGEIEDGKTRAVVQLLAVFGATAWSNGYGRDLEDQADRVGLRYAYEAGFDISKGPRLWNRFAKRYGEEGKVANFFFGNHSLSRQRAVHLEREIALNSPEGPREDGPARLVQARLRGGRPMQADRNGRPPEPVAAPPRDEPVRALAPSPQPKHATANGVAANGPAAAPKPGSKSKEIRVGMTPAEVRALLGAPKEELRFGAQERWTYPDLSVVFEGGRVKDVKF